MSAAAVTSSMNSQNSSPTKPATLSNYQSSPRTAASNQTLMSNAMRGLWVGPMPVKQFLDDFLDIPTEAAPSLPSTYFDAMPDKKIEKEMYLPFIALVDGPKLIPGFKIIDTSDYPDHDSAVDTKIKPDPTMYRESLDTKIKKTQFGELELHFEFKPDKSSDPFSDPKADISDEDRLTHDFESGFLKRSKCRGQLCSYVTEWSTRQHRRFAFTVFIGDPFVRFIRWDRSGAVVSEKFNYRENSEPLIDFLWRFTHLDDAGRGHDTTVRSATEDEKLLAYEHLDAWENNREKPVIVLTISHEGKNREFIAWGSMANARSLTGRSTRAYPVYEAATDKLFFLKDTWRAHDLEKESAILNELKEHNVQHVPRFECGDDIPNHLTLTDRYIPASNEDDASTIKDKRDGSWLCGTDGKRITQRFHHRFIVDTIGKHLDTFESSKQMLQAVSDAFTAHQQAYIRCRIIHRDISARNILIVKGGGGILNDWDLARHEEDMRMGPRRHERTGTWQFMSTLLLMDRHKLHTIQDDIESFIHIVLYHGLRYLKHSQPDLAASILREVFDYETLDPRGGATGGKMKLLMFSTREPLGLDFHFLDHQPLTEWLDSTLDAVKEWIEYSRGQAKRKSSAPSVQLQLRDHGCVSKIFEKHLSASEWPSNDKAMDALQRKGTAQTKSDKRRRDDFDEGEGDSEGSVRSSRVSKRSKKNIYQPAYQSSLRHSTTDGSA